MECYNEHCKERKDCHKYKRAICLKRVTQKQYEFKKNIKGSRLCVKCGKPTVRGKLTQSKKEIRLCMSCGHVAVVKVKEKVC